MICIADRRRMQHLLVLLCACFRWHRREPCKPTKCKSRRVESSDEVTLTREASEMQANRHKTSTRYLLQQRASLNHVTISPGIHSVFYGHLYYRSRRIDRRTSKTKGRVCGCCCCYRREYEEVKKSVTVGQPTYVLTC